MSKLTETADEAGPANRMDDPSPPPPTQLLAALWDNNRAAALLLVAAGADPNTADTRDIGQAWTPLHFAAAEGDLELVQALVAAGAEVDARSVADQTPLWWACNGGHGAVVQELLSVGADPNARSTERYSPLGRILRSDAALMELLRSYGGVI